MAKYYRSRFYKDKILLYYYQHNRKNIEEAVEMLVDYARKLVSRINPGGKFPSAPGEPPKMVTGRPRASIKGKVEPKKNKINGYVYTDDDIAPYGLFLEFGTSKMKPRPFLRPTLYNNRPKLRQMLLRRAR